MLNLFARPSLSLASFQQLVERASGRWYGACLQLTQDAGAAEDAVQEALLRAWQARSQFRGEAELQTWIHRIAINCAIDGMRRRKHAFVELDEATELPLVPSLEHALSRSQQWQNLASALKQLTDMERTCFVLKHNHGYALSEIAGQLRIGEGSVKQALFRALKKLRHWLEPNP